MSGKKGRRDSADPVRGSRRTKGRAVVEAKKLIKRRREQERRAKK